MTETVFARMMRWSTDFGWNQSELASRLGLLPQHISNWKRRGVPSDRLADISQLLKRSIEELLGITSESPAHYFDHWPFDDVDETKVRDLSRDDCLRLEAAVLIAAAQVGLDIKKD